ncbi:tripartite tricarboxylate transporter substrate binding protein [Advenella sp. FME57]|uniref:tripartite tricarboxylate transporter substrate binding protein n=1 Tax=Advenella sp. FME57 TaxID=2742604 RepID=UPI001867F0E1|nr:tripartite tricarboxylate transporter substrate binding protein [Advenella sp. FME57]
MKKMINPIKFMNIALLAIAPCLAHAAGNYPDKAISIVVPYAAGGSTDLIGRALGESMGRYLKQTIVIENKPGAAGSMGAQEMVRARPDGYKLTLAPHGIFRQPYLQKTRYDPIKDLTYIASFSTYDFALVVDAKSQLKTVKEFVDYAKQHPDEISVGTPGRFTGNQMVMVELGNATGAKLTHVPYKGDAEAITALLGGHIKAAITTNSILPYMEAGTVRVLAVASKERLKAFDSVPTFTEAGYPVVIPSPLGLAGPKGMPSEIVEKLDAAVQAAVKDPVFLKAIGAYGIQTYYMNHTQYAEFAVKTFAEEKDIVGKMNENNK